MGADTVGETRVSVMDEDELNDTPESATIGRRPQTQADRDKAREMRDGPVFKNLKAKFRANCARNREPCHLCGDAIDYRLDYGHPQAFELDHIKTVKERPDLVLDVLNFGASHHDCNQNRGTDDPPLHLGTPSEIW
jgi:hypothetical protein